MSQTLRAHVSLTWRQRLQTAAVRGLLGTASRAVRMTPYAAPLRRGGIRVLRDQVYLPGSINPAHRLDIYRPQGTGPWPVLFYVHGGGFGVCSKETHWMMGMLFAAQGFWVANINYRLAPKHPFPAAYEDAARALGWVAEHAAESGGRIDALVLAGESAGANLVTGLALGLSHRRPEPFAAPLFDLALKPRAVVAACGLMQVADVNRFGCGPTPVHPFVQARLSTICDSYLGTNDADAALANPLLTLEAGPTQTWHAQLPPFFIPVGSRDPLLEDSRRLATALQAHGVPSLLREYPGCGHAFHALFWSAAAKACWKDTDAFLQALI